MKSYSSEEITVLYQYVTKELEGMLFEYKLTVDELFSYVRNNGSDFLLGIGLDFNETHSKVLNDCAVHLLNRHRVHVVCFETFKFLQNM